MVLEKRQCPNCGSGEILEKDGTYVCMNCRTFFDNPNDVKITKRDETQIEKIRAKERMKKEDDKMTFKVIVFVFGAMFLLMILCKIFE